MKIDNLVGQTFGSYQLRELLGEGAMGAVYRAVQLTLEREVAVKVLRTDLAEQPDYLARFTREAKIVAALDHPNIVTIHDYGAQDNHSYVAMQFVRGGTLAQRINHRADVRGPLPSLGETASVLRQLALALDHAHAKHIVHRDIKPSNIMFTEQGTPILVDFGIARLLDATSELTQEHQTFGTPHYMPPEQWRAEELTPETDQYALAVVIYGLVTGQPPFDAPTPHALMYKHFEEDPPAVNELRASLPVDLTGVLRRALSKRPDDRFETVELFARAFEKAIHGQTGTPNGFFTFNLPEHTVELTPVQSPPPAPPAPEDLASTDPPDQSAAPTVEHPPVPDWNANTVQRAAPTLQHIPPVPSAPASPPPRQPVMPAAPPQGPRPLEAANGPVGGLVIGVGIGALLLIALLIGGVWLVGSQLGWFERPEATAQPTTIGSVVTSAPTSAAAQPTSLPGAVTSNTPPTSPIVIQPVAPGGDVITAVNAGDLTTMATLQHGADPVRAVAFSPDGSVLATGVADGSIRLWDAASGTSRGQMTSSGGVTYDIAFSPDGTQLVSGHDDGSVRLWALESRRQIVQFDGHTDSVRAVAFSPDAASVASASEDFTARVWNVQSRQATLLEGHTNRVLGVAFNPDGALVATASDDGTARVWDPATGIEVLQFGDRQGEMRGASFSPDGSLLAVPAVDSTVQLYDLATGAEAARLSGHSGWVWAATFAPDGTLLVSGGRDNVARVWSVANRQAVATLRGHGGWVLDVAVNPNGGSIATAGGDGTARLWVVR